MVYIINADLAPTEANPHRWLVLSGIEPGFPGSRVMTGTLRSSYRGFSITAAAFGRAKVRPVPSTYGGP